MASGDLGAGDGGDDEKEDHHTERRPRSQGGGGGGGGVSLQDNISFQSAMERNDDDDDDELASTAKAEPRKDVAITFPATLDENTTPSASEVRSPAARVASFITHTITKAMSFAERKSTPTSVTQNSRGDGRRQEGSERDPQTRDKLISAMPHVKAAVDAARATNFLLRRRVVNLRKNVRDVVVDEVEGALEDVQEILLPKTEVNALREAGAIPDPAGILPSLAAPLHRSILANVQWICLFGNALLILTTIAALLVDSGKTCDGEPRLSTWLYVKLGHDAIVYVCRFYVYAKARSNDDEEEINEEANQEALRSSEGMLGRGLLGNNTNILTHTLAAYASDAELRNVDRLYGCWQMRLLTYLNPFTVMQGFTGSYLVRRAECRGCTQRMAMRMCTAHNTLFAGIFLYHAMESAAIILLTASRIPYVRTAMRSAAEGVDEMLAYPVVTTLLDSFVLRQVNHAALAQIAAASRRARELTRLREQEKTLASQHDAITRRIEALEELDRRVGENANGLTSPILSVLWPPKRPAQPGDQQQEEEEGESADTLGEMPPSTLKAVPSSSSRRSEATTYVSVPSSRLDSPVIRPGHVPRSVSSPMRNLSTRVSLVRRARTDSLRYRVDDEETNERVASMLEHIAAEEKALTGVSLTPNRRYGDSDDDGSGAESTGTSSFASVEESSGTPFPPVPGRSSSAEPDDAPPPPFEKRD
ncbi:hypothetical protein NFJ02_02g71620 [Pycnococcus provasolii]